MRNLAAVLVLVLASCSGSPKPTGGGPGDPGDPGDEPPREPTAAEKLVENLAQLRFDQLGHPVIRWDAIPPVRAPRARPHKLLVVLVEYSDVRFERFRRDPNQGTRLAAHYQEQLFDDSYLRKDTLSHYYAEQSDGAYFVTGQVLPPVRLSKRRRAYGSPDRPVGGDWRNDADPEEMVAEALKLAVAANQGLDWGSFDRWDPTDHDGDGRRDEADGYLDHFVLVFAGGGQSSCQLLQKIGSVLTANVDNRALAGLDRRQRACADRMWPHRGSVNRNEGKGPRADNTRGGVALSEDLWVYDYNMQSEYTAAATFIHEFGHSIGLPDVYARTSSNSTGPWEVMSATADPSPQSLSAWSRMQLGWLNPVVIRPPGFGGKATAEVELARLGDRGDETETNAERAAMIILPPIEKIIDLTELPASSGKTALYGGQGNEMNRTMSHTVDLSAATTARLSFDAWFEIEGGWDFAYVEVKTDSGWKRIVPTDRTLMPAKKGHDGAGTTPGFTGLSGDLDGDGKNENAPGCDPKKEIKSGEDSVGAERNPCQVPTWIRPVFSLDPWVGQKDVTVRIRYYTDGAAVMRGILVDNVTIQAGDAAAVSDDFESGAGEWKLEGFTASPGRHQLLVPHYYLVEYRDPYAATGYDAALARSSWAFYHDPTGDRMVAIEARKRPGVVVWYFNGSFAWSENDPAINGPGKGYLLAVDANPSEIELPGFEGMMRGNGQSTPATHYDVKSPEAQSALEQSYNKTVCFVRSRAYLPRGHRCRKVAGVARLTIEKKRPMYSYEVINEHLPGTRDKLRKVSELVDVRIRKGAKSYRLRDRSLRHYHTYDAPLSFEKFDRGIVIYEVADGALAEIEARSYPAVSEFDDGATGRWLNPKLPFGGVASPAAGLTISVAEPGAGAPNNARATVKLRWAR